MEQSLDIGCDCGAFRATLERRNVSRGTHLVCYCRDCQAAMHHLGRADVLDAAGGTHLCQTVPSGLTILAGAEHLACNRLSPKGILRWYASCCNTPLFNTLAKPGFAFVGVHRTAMSEDAKKQLGPVRSLANTKGASVSDETVDPPKQFGLVAAVALIFARHFGQRLTRKHRTPLFDETGVPVVQPTILTLEERRAATPAD